MNNTIYLKLITYVTVNTVDAVPNRKKEEEAFVQKLMICMHKWEVLAKLSSTSDTARSSQAELLMYAHHEDKAERKLFAASSRRRMVTDVLSVNLQVQHACTCQAY